MTILVLSDDLLGEIQMVERGGGYGFVYFCL